MSAESELDFEKEFAEFADGTSVYNNVEGAEVEIGLLVDDFGPQLSRYASSGQRDQKAREIMMLCFRFKLSKQVLIILFGRKLFAATLFNLSALYKLARAYEKDKGAPSPVSSFWVRNFAWPAVSHDHMDAIKPNDVSFSEGIMERSLAFGVLSSEFARWITDFMLEIDPNSFSVDAYTPPREVLDAARLLSSATGGEMPFSSFELVQAISSRMIDYAVDNQLTAVQFRNRLTRMSYPDLMWIAFRPLLFAVNGLDMPWFLYMDQIEEWRSAPDLLRPLSS